MSYPNDNFASATEVFGDSGSITPFHYDGIGDPATSEPGEDVYGAGETLWWMWTATFTGTAYFTTAGSPSDTGRPSGLDTKIQVFLDFSTVTAYNDDIGFSPLTSYTFNSYVEFDAVAGTTYWFQVDMYGSGEAGTLHLAWGGITPPTFTWTTVATDTFDRPDSATNINPSSDGGTYTVPVGTAGISGNTGYFPIGDPLNDSALAWRDVGSSIQDVSVDSTRSATIGSSHLFACWDGVMGHAGYDLAFDSSGSYGRISGPSGHDDITFTPWTGGTTRLRMVVYPVGGVAHVEIYQDGVLIHTFVDSPAAALSYTGIAFGTSGHSFGTFTDQFDNLIVKTGVLIDPSATTGWQVGSVAW